MALGQLARAVAPPQGALGSSQLLFNCRRRKQLLFSGCCLYWLLFCVQTPGDRPPYPSVSRPTLVRPVHCLALLKYLREVGTRRRACDTNSESILLKWIRVSY
jgi:hypothetical protein